MIGMAEGMAVAEQNIHVRGGRLYAHDEPVGACESDATRSGSLTLGDGVYGFGQCGLRQRMSKHDMKWDTDLAFFNTQRIQTHCYAGVIKSLSAHKTSFR